MVSLAVVTIDWILGAITILTFYRLYKRYGGRATKSAFGFAWFPTGVLLALIAITVPDAIVTEVIMLLSILSWLVGALVFLRYVR